ncbi:MAG: bifunctional folylpolyglutamate synthase/dihydrofolate synthase [Bryobacteraceae bacterium]|nr:bifunctional folylpolyglutamate synthase/dihydrofolate synthase [Bryobacteraceae bacterium]
MNYPESVQFLYSLGNELKTVKLGLQRIQAVLDALGNPERRMRIVHVAGTNGKGSTCAMIEAAMRAAGRRTGLFTSPHLVEPAERIQIGGAPVSRADFSRAFDAVHAAVDALIERGAIDGHTSYFETITAMGFWLFREAAIEWLVLEVGLGGRLDATNCVTPELCVITPVDFDHEQYLGGTLESIAFEKAGILKAGVPAVIAPQHAEAMAVIEARARELGVEPWRAAEWTVRDLEMNARGCRYRAENAEGALEVRCPLAGEHQVQNSLTAALALSRLGVDLAGMSDAVWPGRLERVSEQPEVILDGAHNPAGARALAAYIKRFYGGRRVRMIYGTMRDKAIEEIAEVLLPLAQDLVLTAPDSPRALRPAVIRDFLDRPGARIAENVAQAIEMMQPAQENDVLFITGSLFLVGEARALLVK